MPSVDTEVGGGARPALWLPSPGWWIALLVLSGVGFLTAVGFWAPAAVRAFDYDGAYRCSSTPNPACYAEQDTTVQAVGTTGTGRGAQSYLELRGYGLVELHALTGVYSVAHVGDT